nr:MAG: hypothetical protein 3 [Solemoviridae sp.]
MLSRIPDFVRIQEVEELHPPIGRWHFDGTNEIESFLVHVRLRSESLKNFDLDFDRERILFQFEKLFPSLKIKIAEDMFSFERFYTVIRELNFSASVGYPYCRVYPTIGDMFGWDGVRLDNSKLTLWYNVFLIWLKDPQPQPFRVFIKDELVNQKKFDQGRLRLIFVSPIMNQILDHLLFDEMNQLEQELAWEVPTKLGWHPFWGASEKLVSHFENPTSLDKSMWDWTVTWELLQIDRDFRKRMIVNLTPEIEKYIDLSYDFAYKQASFIFSNGVVVKQLGSGIMKSGLVNTLSTNSHLQVVIHLLAQQQCGHQYKMWCLGDDVVMSRPCPLYKQILSKYCVVKEFEDGYLFAGFNCFTKEPLYWSKHVNNLLYATDEELPELLASYQRLYVFSPRKLALIQNLLMDLNPSLIVSKESLKYWAVFSQSLDQFQYRVLT